MSVRRAQPESVPSSELLAGKIQSFQRHKLKVETGAGLARAVTVFLLLIAAEMVVDWRLELPWALRLIWLLAALAAVVHLINEQVVLPVLDRLDTDRTALLVERHFPDFNSRLISSLQFTRPGALRGSEAPGLVLALIRQTESVAERLDFNSIVRTDALRRRLVWLLGLIGVGGLLFGIGGLTSAALLQRALLSTSGGVIPSHFRPRRSA
jgi:hypothetical protein